MWTVALVFGATEMHIYVCISVYAAADKVTINKHWLHMFHIKLGRTVKKKR